MAAVPSSGGCREDRVRERREEHMGWGNGKRKKIIRVDRLISGSVYIL